MISKRTLCSSLRPTWNQHLNSLPTPEMLSPKPTSFSLKWFETVICCSEIYILFFSQTTSIHASLISSSPRNTYSLTGFEYASLELYPTDRKPMNWGKNSFFQEIVRPFEMQPILPSALCQHEGQPK